MLTKEPVGVIDAPPSTVLEEVRDLVRPFAEGRYVDDWQDRCAELGLLSDRYSLLSKENGYWSTGMSTSELRPLSRTTTRGFGVPPVVDRPQLAMNFDFGTLEGEDLRVVASAAARLDSAEKIVISTAAYCLYQFDNPPELTLELMNLLYEEGLHLEAIGRLLGIDHSTRPWIPEDRRANWELVRGCRNPLEYMIIEHCLYEGRGTIASAGGAYQLERAGVAAGAVAVMDGIAMQEANHNISGFRWVRLFDRGRPEDDAAMAAVVKRFVDVEPLPEADGSSTSLRKHFPLYLFQKYRETGDLFLMKEEIVTASRNARQTGRPGVAASEIYSSAERAVKWCSELG